MWVRYKKKPPINMNFVVSFELLQSSVVFKDANGNTITTWDFQSNAEANDASTKLMKKIEVYKL